MKRLLWNALTVSQQRAALSRPKVLRGERLYRDVEAIIARVRKNGDAALRAYALKFDGLQLDALAVTRAEFRAAEKTLSAEVKNAIDEAIARLMRWHQAGMAKEFSVQTAPGVRCGRILRPIARVGLYIPAGSAPLPSTVMMLGVPAKLAGCTDVVLCTPAQRDGSVDPAILYAAAQCGIRQVFKTGGAQAIAAMAFGTESIPRCDKLFGPGNAYVATAKQIVQSHPDGPAIDMPAGPSEVLVIADAQAIPAFVAADLLAQAEHGPESQVICLCTDAEKLQHIALAVREQVKTLPRRDIVRQALKYARLIQVPKLDTAFALSNRYAPEHLILAIADAESHLPKVQAAGSVFLGNWASESLGDYCSGTNHTLPTNGFARAYSGVSVASFQLFISTQSVTRQGNRNIGTCAEVLAMHEGLQAHARAVGIRRESTL